MPKKIIIILIASLLLLGIIYYLAPQEENEKTLPEKEFYTSQDIEYIESLPGRANIYYMWMQGCPVCAALDKWFEEMKDIYNIKVYKFNIARESALFTDVLNAYSVPAERRGFVPFVFISDEYFIGFNQEIAQDMEKIIKQCLESKECINPYDKIRN